MWKVIFQPEQFADQAHRVVVQMLFIHTRKAARKSAKEEEGDQDLSSSFFFFFNERAAMWHVKVGYAKKLGEDPSPSLP